MKLVRYISGESVKTGIAVNDIIYDTTAFSKDYNESFFETNGLSRLQKFVEEHMNTLPVADNNVKLLSPVARPSKIICIGLNYTDHAKETNVTLPPEPVIFFKSTTALAGPNDDIITPKKSTKTDWEVALALVINKKAFYVDETNAMEYVAGYCLHNDLSEREFQLERSGTWDKGKGCDTFAPMGPYLATKDEIKNEDNLRLWLKVNGKLMQDGNTATMLFKIPFLVSYVSQFMTLLPGDIISTGTPAGVGLGMNPQVYLKPGDVVELGIDGLGTMRQNVKAYE